MARRESTNTNGVRVVMLATFVATFELLHFRSLGRFHPVFLPAVCTLLPVGIYTQWSNTDADDVRSGRVPPSTVHRVFGLMLVCGALGFVGNFVIAGRPW
jgi:hypothetical protein